MITNKRFLSTTLAAACCFALLHGAQAQTDYEVPRTEWDQPDLQGVWNFSSNTPMQRPTRYGTQEFLTAEQIEEAVERQARTAAAAEVPRSKWLIRRHHRSAMIPVATMISGLKWQDLAIRFELRTLSIRKMAVCLLRLKAHPGRLAVLVPIFRGLSGAIRRRRYRQGRSGR